MLLWGLVAVWETAERALGTSAGLQGVTELSKSLASLNKLTGFNKGVGGT